MAKEAPVKTGLTVGLNRGHVRVIEVSPRGGSLLRELVDAAPTQAEDGR
jgi:hypothetical protein